MPQTSSFVITNNAGAAVRARINEVIAALQSTSAGASAPGATVAGMLWVDTSASPPVLRRRNATNTGWDHPTFPADDPDRGKRNQRRHPILQEGACASFGHIAHGATTCFPLIGCHRR